MSQKQRTATIYIWFIYAKVGKHRQNREVDMIVLTFCENKSQNTLFTTILHYLQLCSKTLVL